MVLWSARACAVESLYIIEYKTLNVRINDSLKARHLLVEAARYGPFHSA